MTQCSLKVHDFPWPETDMTERIFQHWKTDDWPSDFQDDWDHQWPMWHRWAPWMNKIANIEQKIMTSQAPASAKCSILGMPEKFTSLLTTDTTKLLSKNLKQNTPAEFSRRQNHIVNTCKTLRGQEWKPHIQHSSWEPTCHNRTTVTSCHHLIPIHWKIVSNDDGSKRTQNEDHSCKHCSNTLNWIC